MSFIFPITSTDGLMLSVCDEYSRAGYEMGLFSPSLLHLTYFPISPFSLSLFFSFLLLFYLFILFVSLSVFSISCTLVFYFSLTSLYFYCFLFYVFVFPLFSFPVLLSLSFPLSLSAKAKRNYPSATLLHAYSTAFLNNS